MILASGDHFVSERVLVEQRVCIVGETGAVVRTGVGPGPVIDAVFHLRGQLHRSDPVQDPAR